MPSSVLSSDSMHIGLLAAAAHASTTNSCFTVFYNPRWQKIHVFYSFQFLHFLLLIRLLCPGLVHLSLSYPYQNTLKQYFTHVFQLGCDFGCFLRLKSQVSEGNITRHGQIQYFYNDCLCVISLVSLRYTDHLYLLVQKIDKLYWLRQIINVY